MERLFHFAELPTSPLWVSEGGRTYVQAIGLLQSVSSGRCLGLRASSAVPAYAVRIFKFENRS